MSTPLLYPKLASPPGWSRVRSGMFIAMLPRGTPREGARAAIIVSPIVVCPTRVPSLEKLVALTLATVTRSFDLVDVDGPWPALTEHGLSGVRYEVLGFTRIEVPVERRHYVMIGDGRFACAAAFLASAPVYARHLPAFRGALSSLRLGEIAQARAA